MLLVVEIRSPSTALIDLNRKKAAYERFAIMLSGLWLAFRRVETPS